MRAVAIALVFTMAPVPAFAGGLFGNGGLIRGDIGNILDATEAPVALEHLKITPIESPREAVTIFFEGGTVGDNMAEVIRRLDSASLLSGEPRQIEQQAGLCSVLEREIALAPENCTASLIAAVVEMNARSGYKIAPNQVSGTIVVPNVDTGTFTFKRYFDTNYPSDRSDAENINNNSAWSSALGSKTAISDDNYLPPVIEQEFTGTRWSINLPSDPSVDLSTVYNLRLPNVRLAVDRPDASPALSVDFDPSFDELFSHDASGQSASESFEDWCTSDDPHPLEGSFSDYLIGRYETPVPICEPDAPVLPSYVMADAAFIPHADNAAALESPQGPRPTACREVDFVKKRHHGNMILGILASAHNGYAFSGMSPGASVSAYYWGGGLDETVLWRFYSETQAPATPQIFVLPFPFSKFDTPVGPMDDAQRQFFAKLWSTDTDAEETAENNWGIRPELADPDSRFLGKEINRVIRDMSASLFVVAAGQNKVELRALTPTSPQNLGDLKNVIVVGGCENCYTQYPTLWEKSNYSVPGGRYVHILAPATALVPVLVGTSGKEASVTSTAGGTSAASAFVSGVAGQMMACYPRLYTARPDQVKLRLTVTSQPLLNPSDIERVDGGVVDPDVAMLAPTETWLKLQGSKIEQVEFQNWCGASLQVEGADSIVDLRNAARITSVVSGGHVVTTVQRSAEDQSYLVKRYGPGSLQPGTDFLAAVSRNGSACGVRANDVDDLLLRANDPGNVGTCQAIPSCAS